MAKTQTVGEHADLRERLDPPGSMPPAPEGSAERVRVATCVDCGWVQADCKCATGFTLAFDPTEATLSPEAKDGSILVNGYDANGEAEAVRIEPSAPEQKSMPGFEKPDLWDRFEGRRIQKVILSFAGTCDLSRDPELCRRLGLREEVAFTIEGEVTGKAFKLRTDKNGVTTVDGVATINVTGVAGEGGRDLEAVREAAYVAAIGDAIGVVERFAGSGEDVSQLLERLGLLRDPDYAEEPDDEEDEPSALNASLAEALAE